MTKQFTPLRLDAPVDLSAELRQLAAAIPGLKPGTLAVLCIRAGLPLIRVQLGRAAASFADDVANAPAPSSLASHE